MKIVSKYSGLLKSVVVAGQIKSIVRSQGNPGPIGPTGPTGPTGPAGANGVGVPAGGTAGQILSKVDGTDYNTKWINPVTGAGVWGAITGNITDQTDLVNYIASQIPGSLSPGNPSANIGLSAVNGVASTYMRSDAAPALSQAITPTWTGLHKFTAGLVTSSGVNGVPAFLFSEDRVGLGTSTNAGLRSYPASGTNVAASFAVFPKGTGASSTYKTALGIWNTDFVADSTNFEAVILSANGTGGFTLGTYNGGSGAKRNLYFDVANVNDHTNPSQAKQISLYTGGSVGINTRTESSFILDVLGAGQQTGRFNYTGAASSTGGAFVYITSTIPTAADQRFAAIVFGGAVSGGANNSAVIAAYSSEAHGTSGGGSYLTFSTTPNGSPGSFSEVMRVDQNGVLSMRGNRSAPAWTNSGAFITVPALTVNDTTSSGTVANNYGTYFGRPTFTAASATTYTIAATVYIDQSPLASTNVTNTQTWGLYVNAATLINGTLISNGSVFTHSNGIGTANLNIASGTGAVSTTNAYVIFGSSTPIFFRNAFGGSTSTTLTTGAAYANTVITTAPITTFSTGTHAWLVNLLVQPIGTVTSGGATVSNTASLYVNGAGTGGTGNYAIYTIGNHRFDAGQLTFAANRSLGAWGTNGALIQVNTITVTDTSTAASGTAANAYMNSFSIPTFAATNTSVTMTTVATMYVAGAPATGTNVTFGNAYAIYVGGGSSRFDGAVIVNAGTLQVTGNRNSGAWGVNGPYLQVIAATVTDSTTAVSGTAATAAANSIAQTTFAAANTGVTITQAFSLYIAGPPIAGTNVTLPNPFALFVNAGLSNFGGGFFTGNSTSSNVAVGSGTGSQPSAAAGIQFASSSNIAYRVAFNGNTSSTLATGVNYVNTIVGSSPITTFSTGTHPWLANLVVNPLGTVTSGGATVTNTATLYVNGAGSGGTSNYSLYVSGGNIGFNGPVIAFGGLQTNSPFYTANFGANGNSGITASTTTASLLFGAATSIAVRAVFNGFTSSTLTANDSYVNMIVGSSPITTPATGTNAWLANMVINPIGTVTSGGATISNSASLYINGAGAGASVNYALYVASGASTFLGGISTVGNSVGNGAPNFYSTGGGGINGTTATGVLFAGTTTVNFRSSFYGTTATTLGTGNTFGSVIFGSPSLTTFTSGNHAVLANAVINPMGAVTAGGATIGLAALLWINGVNAVASTTNYGLYIATDSIGVTSTNALSIRNSTAATVGAQQISGSLTFEGQGWKTTTTAGSQSVKFLQYVLPVQGTANPGGQMVWQYNINGAGNTTGLTLDAGAGNGAFLGIGAQTSPIAPIDINYTIPVTSADVMVARFVGTNNLVSGVRNAYIKFGVGGAVNAYYDIVNDGGGSLLFRYGNSATAINTSGTPFSMINDGRVSISGSLYIGAGYTFISSAMLGFAASTTAKALMNLTVGVAPTSPNDGDVWREDNTNTGLKIRVNGVTKTFSFVGAKRMLDKTLLKRTSLLPSIIGLSS